MESTFGTSPFAAGAATRVWGLEQKVDSWSLTNNKIPIWEFNSLLPSTYAYGTTRGSLGVSWVLSNPLFLDTIFDNVAHGGATPFTHTYSISSKLIKSFSAELGVELGTTDSVRTLKGCIVNSINMRSTIGDVVRCSADISYANEAQTTTVDSSVPTDSSDWSFPYTFANGALTIAPHAGSTEVAVGELQSIDLTFNQNPELLWGHNSTVAVGAYRKQFEITGRLNASFTDSDSADAFLTRLYAQTGLDSNTVQRETPATGNGITLTFSNGLTSSSMRKIEIKLSGIAIDSVDLEGFSPNEPIFQNIPFQARVITSVIASDNLNGGTSYPV